MVRNADEIDIDFIDASGDDDDGDGALQMTNIDMGDEGEGAKAGDAELLGREPLLTVAFDLNGVLIERTRERLRSGAVVTKKNLPRPGLHHLVSLLDSGRIRLGIFTSATERTARGAIQRIEQVINQHPSVRARNTFTRPFDFLLHREHCRPASADHIARGGNEWDTVKPLGGNFSDVSRIVLVDDDLHKAFDGEEQHLLHVPSHPLPDSSRKDCVLAILCTGLLALLPEIPASLPADQARERVTQAIHAITQRIRDEFPTETAGEVAAAAVAEARGVGDDTLSQPLTGAGAGAAAAATEAAVKGGKAEAAAAAPRPAARAAEPQPVPSTSAPAAAAAPAPAARSNGWRRRALDSISSFVRMQCDTDPTTTGELRERLFSFLSILVRWAVWTLQRRKGFTFPEVEELQRVPALAPLVSAIGTGKKMHRAIKALVAAGALAGYEADQALEGIEEDIASFKFQPRFIVNNSAALECAEAGGCVATALLPTLASLSTCPGASILDLASFFARMVPKTEAFFSRQLLGKVLMALVEEGGLRQHSMYEGATTPLGRFWAGDTPPLQEAIDVAIDVIQRFAAEPKAYASLRDLTAPSLSGSLAKEAATGTGAGAGAGVAPPPESLEPEEDRVIVGKKRARSPEPEKQRPPPPSPPRRKVTIEGVDLGSLGLFVDVEAGAVPDVRIPGESESESDEEEEDDEEEFDDGELNGSESDEDESDDEDEDEAWGGEGMKDEDGDFSDDGYEDAEGSEDELDEYEYDDGATDPPPTKRARKHSNLAEGLAPAGTLSTLHYELQAFADRCASSADERARITELIRQINDAAQQIWGVGASAHLFGSQATGLALPGSDLDVVVLGSPIRPSANPAAGVSKRERSLVASRLRELLTALRRRGLVHRAIVIEARVPIIKGEFDLPNAGGNIGTRGLGSAPKSKPLQVDISLGVENGLQAVGLIQSLMDAIPPTRPLTLAVKALLKAKGLNETYTGGLSSYSTVNLVVAHLQAEGYRPDALHVTQSLGGNAGAGPKVGEGSGRGAPPSPPPGARPGDLGVLLARFFKRYGYEFNFKSTAVSIRSGGFMMRPSHWTTPRHFARSSLSIGVEDPQVRNRDIGGGAYNVREVRRIFADSADTAYALLDQDRGLTAAPPPAALRALPGLSQVFPALALLAGWVAPSGGASGGKNVIQGEHGRSLGGRGRGGAGRGRGRPAKEESGLFVTIGDDEFDAVNERKGRGKRQGAKRGDRQGKKGGKASRPNRDLRPRDGGVGKKQGSRKQGKREKKEKKKAKEGARKSPRKKASSAR